MIKEQKGITMITLVITIMVILIIMGITLQGSQKLFRDTELKNNITDMLLIQARAEIIYDKNQFDEEVKLVGIQLTPENVGAYNHILSETYNIESEEELNKWYVWNTDESATPEGTKSAKSELEDLKVNLADGKYYIVNYEAGEVIYSEGYKNKDNKIVYKLSEMQDISDNK